MGSGRNQALVAGLWALCVLLASCDALLGLDGEDELDCASVQASAPGWLVRSCIMRVSCSPFVETLKIGQCIGRTAPFATAYDRCTSKANSCADIQACTGVGRAAAALCDQRSKGWHCQGDRALRCGYGEPYVVECGLLGAKCKLYQGAETASAWPCAVPTAMSCATNDVGFCDGTVAVSCGQGQAWGRDCARQQLRCVQSEGQAFCSAYSEPCDPNAHLGCQDGRYTVCATSGFGLTYDCTTAGGQCEHTSCAPKGCKQIPFESKCRERCLDASRMQICVFWDSLGAGQPMTVDCKDHEFDRCEMLDDPKSSRDFAACR